MVNQSNELAICLLGNPMIRRKENTLSIRRKRCRGIIYYLAAHNRPVSRDDLREFFWPDLNISSAHSNLNVHIYEIRKQVPDIIVSNGNYIDIAPGIKRDTNIFDTFFSKNQHKIADLESILTLYRGEFLNGFYCNDCPKFDDWKTFLQEHYKVLYMGGLSELSKLYLEEGDYHQSLLVIQKMLSIDPYQEEIYRNAMLAHYYLGDFMKVTLTYKKLREVLNEEFGLPPTKETRNLYEAILADKPFDQPRYVPTKSRQDGDKEMRASTEEEPSLPFIGREEEMKTLLQLSHQRGMTLICGSPGCGRSRLLREYAKTWTGFVLYGECHELESNIPYQPIFCAILRFIRSDSWNIVKKDVKKELTPIWWNKLRSFMPEIEPQDNMTSGGAGCECELMEAVTRLIVTLSKKQKLLFAIDDLQWSDNASQILLSYMVRYSKDSNIFFLCTQGYQGGLNPHLLKSTELLKRLNLLQVIQLNFLGMDSIERVAAHIKKGDNTALVQWLKKNSGGNPYALTELTKYLQKQIEVSPEGLNNIDVIIKMPYIPQAIESYVYSYYISLSEQARRVMDAAAVFGAPFDYEDIADAVELSESEAFKGIEELLEKCIIMVDKDGKYAFLHSMPREIAYRQINPSLRQWLQMRISHSIEKEHSDV